MQSDLGKLFVGGISWDTNEERLQEYFSTFGELLEAVIMKDHTIGRARGFGFVVFADPVVAERVIREKHNIDGRMVEAKKAVPRDDQSTISRNSSSIQGSPDKGSASDVALCAMLEISKNARLRELGLKLLLQLIAAVIRLLDGVKSKCEMVFG